MTTGKETGRAILHDGPEIAARRDRLSEVERELARLRYRHDIAMSAFRFEEATALGPAIDAVEKERQALAGSLPTSEPETGARATAEGPKS